MLFERFLSPERVEMPDIDVDFEDERRQEVIEHIKDFYGEDHVSGVITFGKLQAKNAIRDAARVLGQPYSVGDRIVQNGRRRTWASPSTRRSMTNPDFKKAYDGEEPVNQRSRRRCDARLKVNVRGEGVHACATIICRDPMADHVPMKRDTKGGGIITQYDGHYTPDLGLLKMDFLGPAHVGRAFARVPQRRKSVTGIELIPEQIPTEDPKAFRAYAIGQYGRLVPG